MAKKIEEKKMGINRLKVDPKVTGGVDPVSGFKVTAIDKNIFKKDITSPYVNEKSDPEEKDEDSGKSKQPENEGEE
jgi:hypothetical protein